MQTRCEVYKTIWSIWHLLGNVLLKILPIIDSGRSMVGLNEQIHFTSSVISADASLVLMLLFLISTPPPFMR